MDNKCIKLPGICRIHVCRRLPLLASVLSVSLFYLIAHNGRIMVSSSTKAPSKLIEAETFNKLFVNTRLDQRNYMTPFRHKYLALPRKPCRNETLLICLIHSAPSHINLRQNIRRTWGKERHVSAGDTLDGDIYTVFVLGLDKDSKINQLVREEILTYGDIILVNFSDEYQNLNYKARAGLRYVTHACRRAKFVLKSDDDMMINIFKLEDNLSKLNHSSTIYCRRWASTSVKRNKSHKRYVPESVYPQEYYPPFCSGSAYVMTEGVAEILDRYSDYVTSVPGDDVTITGLARKRSGTVDLIDIRKWFFLNNFAKKITRKDLNSAAEAIFVHHPDKETSELLWNRHFRKFMA